MAKVLVVYDSKYGNTKILAETMTHLLKDRYIDADIVSVTTMDYENCAKYDIFIIGSPTHYWNPSQNIITFLSEISRRGIRGKLGFIFSTKLAGTLLGSAGKRIFISLKYLSFQQTIPWLDFQVKDMEGPLLDREIEKCTLFTNQIADIISEYSLQKLRDAA